MHSVLFHIGPLPIRAYGLMLWIAVVIGVIRTVRASRRTDIKGEHVVDVTLYALLAGVVGAHMASVALDLPYYWRNPTEVFSLWGGLLSPSGGLRGLSFHGGLIGGVAAALVYTRRKGINFLAMADLCSPALALSYGITRIGCFLNGCCYGIPTDLPWAIRFHLDSASGGLTPPSHPTQLYAFGASILIYLSLVAVERHRSPQRVGQVFLSYLVLYSVYRFLIEFLRKGVTADVAFAGITQAQLVSLLVLAVALPLLLRRLRESGSTLREIQGRVAAYPTIRNPKSVIRNRKGG